MIKQREDSVAAYEAGNRPELAAAERGEIEVIRVLHAQADERGGDQSHGTDVITRPAPPP